MEAPDGMHRHGCIGRAARAVWAQLRVRHWGWCAFLYDGVFLLRGGRHDSEAGVAMAMHGLL